MPKNATPIKEAVIVLSPEVTMLQLEQLADRWKDKYGISVKSISIHEMKGISIEKQGSGSQTDMLTWLQILPMKRGNRYRTV